MTDSNLLEPNAILLPRGGPALRHLLLPDGGRAASQDASYLPFIVEGLIRFSAVDLAIEPASMYYGAVGRLPPLFKQRIRRVDNGSLAIEKTRYVLEPLWRECGFEFSAVGVQLTRGEEFVGLALLNLTVALEKFIIGCEHGVQVDVDATAVLGAITSLRQVVGDRDNRATLATLEGVFRSYKVEQVPSVVVRSELSGSLGQRFREFIEDETYRRMAQEATLLGIPARATHAVIRMRRAAVDLLAKPRFKATGELASQPLRRSTGVPVPTTESARTILGGGGFLPPLISMRETYDRATDAWVKKAPPFIPVSTAPELADAEALPPSRADSGEWLTPPADTQGGAHE